MVEWFLQKLWPLDLENFSEFSFRHFFVMLLTNLFHILYVVLLWKLQIDFYYSYGWMIFTEVTALGLSWI